jgi:hypothetical protein
MQNPARTLAVLLLDGEATCFVRERTSSWQPVPLSGERWHPLNERYPLASLLGELKERMNVSDHLAAFTLHLIYDQTALQWLEHVPRDLVAVECTHWQVLQWEPLRDRSARLHDASPYASRPSLDWLQLALLPVLDATFNAQDDALAASHAGTEREHADLVARLQADRLRLEAEIAAQREQLAALQRPAVEDVVTYLPALYRNVFGTIAPHDLALLAGSLQVPQIPSPWPEPSPDTLRALQARLRKLPEQSARRLRDFCRELPHKLELRAEMRTWLGDDW